MTGDISTTPICRILVVDDHPIVVAGLSSLIETEPDLEVCGQAGSAATAIEAVRNLDPDLVLVDLSLESSSGLDLLGELDRLQVPALVVSMHDDPVWAERALAAGALGYVHKSVATSEVVTAIQRVRQGRIWVSEEISEQLLRRNVGPPTPAGPEPPTASLTERELEVWSRIGRGLTTRQISDELNLSPKTVQTYRSRIKDKLGLSSAAELSTAATRWVVERTSS